MYPVLVEREGLATHLEIAVAEIHLQVGKILCRGVQPVLTPESVEVRLVEEDQLHLVEIEVTAIHLEDLEVTEERQEGNQLPRKDLEGEQLEMLHGFGQWLPVNLSKANGRQLTAIHQFYYN